MRSRTAALLAWGLWLACVVLAVLSVVFAFLNDFASGFTPYLPTLLAGTLTFSTVGALVAARRRGNPIGWLLLGAGLLFALTPFAGEYGYAFTAGGRPGGIFALWFSSWSWLVPASVILLTFMYFPDGRLPSPRWRVAAWLYGLAVCSAVVPIASRPGPLFEMEARGLRSVPNPLGMEAIAGLLDFVSVVSLPLAFVSGLPVVALVVRYVRATDEERRQIKWVAYAVALLAGVIVATTIWPSLDGSPLGFVLFLLGYGAIPVAIGVAILRHRLFDIDVLINRTLVYAAVSATLILIYLGSVVLLQTAFDWLTGGDSQLAIVASTLAIAALFNPLRRRTQSFVDRRFYRKKYDARETLQEFGSRLRNETDLNTLTADLVSVVQDTLQPEHASVWMRREKTSRLAKNPSP